jgi:cytosine/adenosine deaminase-related metal-dependent hydrolase
VTRRQDLSGRGSDLVTLRARHVLPVLGPPLEGGWVRIARGRIVAVGRRDPPRGTLDLGEVVILPGFVNAHTHLEFSSLAAPLDAAGGLPAWIGRLVAWRRSRAAAGTDTAATAAAIRQGLAESFAAGVTTIGEIATATAAAVGASYRGLDDTMPAPRVRVFREGLGLSAPAGTTAVTAVARALDLDRRRGLLGGVSPHAPYSVAAPLGRRLLALARARGLPVAMHLAESLEEEELLASGGGTFRDLLEALGAWPRPAGAELLPTADWIGRLATAGHGLVVHGTHLGRDPASLDRLARHRDRLGVVVCPRTTRSLSGQLPPVAMFREARVRVALGTDGRASNPDLSILAECRALEHAGVASPTDVLRMATHHGAWALGLGRRCGAVAPGRVADLVMIRPPGPWTDAAAAVLDPAAEIVGVVRRGRVWRASPP